MDERGDLQGTRKMAPLGGTGMTDDLPGEVLDWRDGGTFEELAGLEVFCRDSGPAGSREATLLLHGFPSSGYDWHAVFDRLAAGQRTLAPDFPGFGLSSKPADYSYSLFEQADLVEMLLARRGITAAHLVAHDMGTSVACELAARRERGLLGFHLRSLVLMNGSVHIELSRLTPSQKLLRSPLAGAFVRVASERVFRLQIRRILGRPLPPPELAAMWVLMRHRDGVRRLPKLIGYIDERHHFRGRWIGALQHLDVPVLVLWGPRDPVAVPDIARLLSDEIPGARLQWLEGLGHYPQLEDPDATVSALLGFLDRGSSASRED